MNPILAEEIESLEIIYPDLFTKSSDRELDITVDINSGTEDYLGLKISLFFTEDYPNLGPIFTLKGINNFDVDNDSLKEAINSSIDRNIGNPMIFDIIDSIKN